METNEIMTNNEAVAEATEDIVTTVTSSDNGMKAIAKIGGTAIVVGGVLYLGYKYVVKPLSAKLKAKKDQDEEVESVTIVEDASAADDVDNVEDNE